MNLKTLVGLMAGIALVGAAYAANSSSNDASKPACCCKECKCCEACKSGKPCTCGPNCQCCGCCKGEAN